MTGHLVECANEWITGIDDITEQLSAVRESAAPLPAQRPYPLPADALERISVS